jgi:hypothetical protein
MTIPSKRYYFEISGSNSLATKRKNSYDPVPQQSHGGNNETVFVFNSDYSVSLIYCLFHPTLHMFRKAQGYKHLHYLTQFIVTTFYIYEKHLF